ncbi:MAG: phosphoribosylformylglycinamidine synthase subunit PurS [Candidatus Omnitrophica bacterium]|nr:phosphoribosylformylglycinamidine synthase subunit PurS [Candidatus Omnitrophota bacterium]
MFNVKVEVTLKKQVLDPQGLTVKHALESLGFNEVDEVRMGKFLELKIEAKDRKEAEEKLRRMCEKLLVNPVIEDYTYQIEG